MNIIKPSFEIMNQPHANERISVLQHIEKIGRVCYKSEDRITDDSCIKFIESIRKRKHFSVLEHYTFNLYIPEWIYETVNKIKTDRDRNNPLENSIIRYVNASRIPDAENEDKEFILSISATSINYLWMLIDGVFEYNGLLQVCLFIYKDYPELIESPEFMENKYYKDIMFEMLDKRISYASMDEISDVNINKIHKYETVKLVIDRAVANQLVRHRIVSYAQESQRYVNYTKDKFGNSITFIEPLFFREGDGNFEIWKKSMESAESSYFELIKNGVTPEMARTVLPNSVKTEIVTSTNLQNWYHIFSLRTEPTAHPQMREIMNPLLEEFIKKYPEIFYELKKENSNV